ncbi:MAG: hypothetical protein GY943_13285 [Chloroflexi bacterium]|nr:hypothetical protein [Chloroflexota bacterium]
MQKRSSISAGLIMILIGGIFLIANLFPDLIEGIDLANKWPFIVVAIGLLLLVGALLGNPSLAIQGSITTGIGFILYYQNLTGNWASWAYVWALIPGFAGIGTILMNVLDKRKRTVFKDGFKLIGISLVLFLIFGAFFNGLGNIGQLWPVFLIGAGAWMLFNNRRSN